MATPILSDDRNSLQQKQCQKANSKTNTLLVNMELTKEKRKQEADRIRQKYPDRIPCIVEKAEKVFNFFIIRAILLLSLIHI